MKAILLEIFIIQLSVSILKLIKAAEFFSLSYNVHTVQQGLALSKFAHETVLRNYQKSFE